MIFFAAALMTVGCVGIGAWLVISGHPFFGLLAMLIGGCVSMRHESKK